MAGIDLQNTAEVKWKQQNDAKAIAIAEADTQNRLDAATSKAIVGATGFAVASITVGTLVVRSQQIANGIFGRATKAVIGKGATFASRVASNSMRGLRSINFSALKSRQSKSWSDFYLNMEIDMAKNRFIAFGLPLTKAGAVGSGVLHFESINHGFELLNHIAFADALADTYDETMHQGGKTLWGGARVAHGGGHSSIMKLMLANILANTRASSTGDLLRDIGPAVQAYWTAAFLECTNTLGVPSIPCIGAVKNVCPIPVPGFPGASLVKSANKKIGGFISKGGVIGRAIAGENDLLPTPPHPTANLCLMPGIWTPITVPSNTLMSPFLTSFIASATLHLLTIGGILTALCQYPAPAPLPIPGVLPWLGYWVTPISNPMNVLKSFTAVEYAAALVGKAAETIHSIESKHEEGQHLSALSIVASTQQTVGDAIVQHYHHELEKQAHENGQTLEELHGNHTEGSPEAKLYETYKKTGIIDGETYITEIMKSFSAKHDSRSLKSVQDLKALNHSLEKVNKPNIKPVHH